MEAFKKQDTWLDNAWREYGDTLYALRRYVQRRNKFMYSLARHSDFRPVDVVVGRGDSAVITTMGRIGQNDGRLFLWHEAEGKFYVASTRRRPIIKKRSVYAAKEVRPADGAWPMLAQVLLREYQRLH